MSSWLGRLADGLAPLGLSQPAFRLWERLSALGGVDARAVDGLPVPPAFLRVLTAGSPNAEHFLALGRRAAEEILRLAEAQGGAPGRGDGVLEFGVGCGRVARWMTQAEPTVEFHGCDVDPRLLGWSERCLRGAYALTRQDPPLPYPDGRFALVYALSVFTHMHEPNARAWLAELARVTRPGGLAVLSFLDARLPQAADVAGALARDGFAVRREGAEGSNLLCGYFTADGFAERAAPGWTLMQAVPSDESATGQAIAVFRRGSGAPQAVD